VSVVVSGLPAGARTTVTATATDTSGVPWTSSADFQAGPDRKVSLAQKPVSGYPAADPMALFGLMKPSRGDDVFFAGGRTVDVTLRASLDGKVVAQAIAHRRSPDDVGVRHRDLRPATDGLYGTLYLPADTSTPRPALVVFGGSEGGLSGVVIEAAALLAARGYPALALAYFHEPGLPATLTDVPLEYFARAVRLLRSQPGVDPDHVLVQGASRGGEGAWPSCIFVDAISFRLKQHHFRYPVTVLKYPDGGHYVGIFTTSYTSWTPAALEPAADGLTPGGTLPATLAGAADSHAKLLALLGSL